MRDHPIAILTAAAFVIASGAVLAASARDIARYLRIRRM